MNKEDHYQMSQKQLGRYVTISRLSEGQITTEEAANSLGLSTWQILRLKKEVREFETNALIHKNSGRKPHHAIDDSLREKIITLKISHPYSNTNFQHFQELRSEYKKIKISYSALYALLSKIGIESPKKCRRFTNHRKRKRKATKGFWYSWIPLPLAGYHMAKSITSTWGLMMLPARLSASIWPKVNAWKDISKPYILCKRYLVFLWASTQIFIPSSFLPRKINYP